MAVRIDLWKDCSGLAAVVDSQPRLKLRVLPDFVRRLVCRLREFYVFIVVQ